MIKNAKRKLHRKWNRKRFECVDNELKLLPANFLVLNQFSLEYSNMVSDQSYRGYGIRQIILMGLISFILDIIFKTQLTFSSFLWLLFRGFCDSNCDLFAKISPKIIFRTILPYLVPLSILVSTQFHFVIVDNLLWFFGCVVLKFFSYIFLQYLCKSKKEF